jgi:hypothetical protein
MINLSSNRVFTLKPSTGLLVPGQHQVFSVRCLPKEISTFKHRIALHLNAMEKNTTEVLMAGSAETAEVLLDNQGVMYFKPTCIGTASLRKYGVKNISRIPLCFDWKIKHADARHLSVEPLSGVIPPNAVQVKMQTEELKVENTCFCVCSCSIVRGGLCQLSMINT